MDEPQSKEPRDFQSLPIRAYLDQSVVPVLLQGLSELAKQRPSNPVKWLGDYLIQHSSTQ